MSLLERLEKKQLITPDVLFKPDVLPAQAGLLDRLEKERQITPMPRIELPKTPRPEILKPETPRPKIPRQVNRRMVDRRHFRPIEIPKAEELGFFERARKSFMMGVGDVLETSGSAMEWLGFEGRELKDWGRDIKDRHFFHIEPILGWRRFINPNWWATTIPRALPFSLSLIPAGIVGAYGGAKIALGLFGKKILTKLAGMGVGASVISRPIESALEAGAVYQEMLRRGKSKKEADKAADEVFRRGALAFGVVDIAQIGLAFTPIGKVKAGARASLNRRILAAGGKIAGVGAMEAGEEIGQEMIQRWALGDEVKWDHQMSEAAAIGSVMGIGLGGAGSVYNVLVARTISKLPAVQQMAIKKSIEDARRGKTKEEADKAELKIIDKMAGTPEGDIAITETIKEIKEKVAEIDPTTTLAMGFVLPTPREARRQVKAEKVKPLVSKELEPLATEMKRYKTYGEFQRSAKDIMTRIRIEFPNVGDLNKTQINKIKQGLPVEKHNQVEFWAKEANREKFNTLVETEQSENIFAQVIRGKPIKAEITPEIIAREEMIEEEAIEPKFEVERVKEEAVPEVEPEPAIPKELDPLAIERKLNVIPTETNKGLIEAVVEDYGFRIGDFKTGRELRDDIYEKYGNEWTVNLSGTLGKGIEIGKFVDKYDRVPDGEETRQIIDKIYGRLINEVKKIKLPAIKEVKPVETVKPKVEAPVISKEIKSELTPIELLAVERKKQKELRKEYERWEKEIKQAKTKPAREAKEKAKQDWLKKIGAITKDKYPFATKEQRRKMYITKPAVAMSLTYNVDWDKLTPVQQGQVELQVYKGKKEMPLEVLQEAIIENKLLIPEKSIKALKYDPPIKVHFPKLEDRPKPPTAEDSIPKKIVDGERLASIVRKFIADKNWDTLEKSSPTFPKEIRELSKNIATEKQKLRAEFREGNISREKVSKEFKKLNNIILNLGTRLGIAVKSTKDGDVILALSKGGQGVSFKFLASDMKDISRIDKYFADVLTQGTTIDQSAYGQFAANVIEPSQQLEIATDQMIGLYHHKMRQTAVKHKILYASKRFASGRERKAIGKLMDILKRTELEKVTTKEILEMEKVRTIMDARKDKEKGMVLEKNLIKFIKEARPIMDEIKKIVNTFRVKYGLEPIGDIEAYLPHMQETNTMAALFGKFNTIKDVMTGMLPDWITPNQYESPHAKARKYGLKTYEIDFFTVFDTYVDTMMKSVFNTMIIHNNKIHAEVLRYKGLDRAASWLETWTAQSYAKVVGPIDKVVLEISPFAYRALGHYRRMLMRMVFPFNLGWSLMTQPASIILALARLGIKDLRGGFHDWFLAGDRKVLREKIHKGYVALQKGKDKYSPLYQDIDGAKLEREFAEKGILEKWEHLGGIVLRMIERHLTGWSIAAGYRHWAKEGLTGKELDYAAQSEGAFSQSLYGHTARPLLLQSRVITSTIPFQTFVFQMFNLAREIGGRTGMQRTVNKRLAMALYIIVGTTLWNEYTERLAGRKLWGWRSSLPFAGAVWSPFEEGRSAFSYVATFNRIHDSLDEFLSTGNFRPIRRDLVRYGTASLGIAGGLKMDRVIGGMITAYKGGIYTQDNKLLVAIPEPEEKLRAFFMGPWATRRGQEYFDLKGERERPGLRMRAYNWIIGRQPTTYSRMKDKVQDHIKRKGYKTLPEIMADAELRDMIAEFNVQQRDRFHRDIFVKNIEEIMTHAEYFSEMKRRTISWEDIRRWYQIK